MNTDIILSIISSNYHAKKLQLNSPIYKGIDKYIWLLSKMNKTKLFIKSCKIGNLNHFEILLRNVNPNFDWITYAVANSHINVIRIILADKRFNLFKSDSLNLIIGLASFKGCIDIIETIIHDKRMTKDHYEQIYKVASFMRNKQILELLNRYYTPSYNNIISNIIPNIEGIEKISTNNKWSRGRIDYEYNDVKFIRTFSLFYN